VFRIVKVVLVISIATQVGLYSDLIANNFIALPDYLSRLVGGGDLTTSSKNTLDKILSDGLDTGKVFWEQGSLNPLDMD
ncbi:type IV secretion system protein, partial [Acinetobacter baumannii]